jgi:uncharacterized protein (DUF58 family)
MNKEIQSLLKPEILNSIKGLELMSKLIIGAFPAGFNQSVHAGQGFEFRQYRTYQPGDDLRLLDWKMYARSDRFYVKEAEAETNMLVRFVIDSSASMRHQANNGLQKIEFARVLAASLAYLALQQGDAIGLYALNENKIQQITPRSDRLHFQRFLYELLQIKAEGKFPQNTENQAFWSNSVHKEMFIFITDMYEEGNEIFKILKQTSALRNEVLLFHLMAENEMELNYQGSFTFEDLETKAKMQVNPSQIKKQYQTTLTEKLAEIKKNTLEAGVTYDLFVMNESLDKALSNFLLRRKALL